MFMLPNIRIRPTLLEKSGILFICAYHYLLLFNWYTQTNSWDYTTAKVWISFDFQVFPKTLTDYLLNTEKL